MSKYWIFVNMKTYIILIILGFTQLGVCSDISNVTYDDNYPVCPVNFFRKKRALTEYTRWRANLDTTPEFIVKVLDDELTTANTKQIVAVNIQPVTKHGEKIIVGGVVIPPVTTSQSILDPSRDYTRFVPPTTVPITRVDEELYLAPAPLSRPIDKIPPIKPRERNSQRDESPPASPQFLARTPALFARQYAPIAPVAFTLKATITPLRPPSTTSRTFPLISIPDLIRPPTRTSPFLLPDTTWPKRTESIPDEEYKEDDHFVATRSTLRTVYDSPIRTTGSNTFLDDKTRGNNEINSYWQNRKSENARKRIEKFLEKGDRDNDASYNMIFYNDDDTESFSKKSELDPTESYDERTNPHDIDSTENIEVTNTTEFDLTTLETTTAVELDYSNEDDVNITSKTPLKEHFSPVNVTTSETVTQTTPIKSDKVRGKRRPICNLQKLRQLNFNSPRTLPEIVSQLKQWADTSPVAKWEDITHGNLTNMENPIYMMIVDDPSSGQIVTAKQTVMIVAGIQGRDHHAVAAAMYVLYQLIERSDAHADLLTKYRFWIIPVFNPDGYDYSMTFPHRREWSKNLRQNWDICKSRDSCVACNLHGLRCTVQPCYGVNLDRNFEYQWIPAEELRAEHPCGSLHAGARQLSEAETWALTHFLHEQRTPLFTFIAFKEGEVLGVMYPYSHTRKLRAFDHVYRQRASRAASAAYSISGRPYVAGQTSEFLPLYAGGIEDWVDGHLGIDNTYTIMMFRPTDSYNSKLITERVVHEAYAAMDTLLLQSVEPLGPPSVALKNYNGAPSLPPHSYDLYLFVILMSILFSRLINTTLINE